MRDRLRVLCRPAVAGGFRLAGIGAVEASDAAEGSAVLSKLLADEQTGVILVAEEFHDALPESERRSLARHPLPLVVPFPRPRWRAPTSQAETFVAELLRQAIGYRVRLG